MEKNKIIIICLIIVVVILGAIAFWYFNKTNSIISQLGGNVKSSSTNAGVKSSEKSITTFTLSELNIGGNEILDNANHKITLIVPHGTDITKLTPVISLPNSATISPSSGVVQNFTKPVVYTVTAEDGSTQSYTVTVEVATPQGSGGS